MTTQNLSLCHSEPKAKNLNVLNRASGEILRSLSLPQDDNTKQALPQDDNTKQALPQDDKTKLASSPYSGLRLTLQDAKIKLTPSLCSGLRLTLQG
jgi:hypothetical protein